MKFYGYPKWATYIAYDSFEKAWFAFEYRPNLHQGRWIYEGRREEVYPVEMDTLGPIRRKV